jgi:hypothetical protein
MVRRKIDPVGWFFYRENFYDMVQELFSAIDRSKTVKNAPFWHMLKTPRLTPPQTPFKTKQVVEGFWKGHISDHRLRACLYRRSAS